MPTSKTLKRGKINNVQIHLISSNLLETSSPFIAEELVASDIYSLWIWIMTTEPYVSLVSFVSSY